VPIYMKFGSVDGPVTTKGFEKWIECQSFQFGVGRAIGTAARGSTSREHSEPSISEVTVTKAFDTASPKLFEDAVGGHLDTKVEFKFTTTTKDGVTTFLSYELEKCGVSGYSVSSGGEAAPSENLSLNFTKIKFSYTGMGTKVSGTPVIVGYDLEKMMKA
jgi:type VI secretion system secreted protein Hcp